MDEEVVNTAELREDYRRNMEELTAEFNSWPSWKQSALVRAVSISSTGSAAVSTSASTPDVEQQCSHTDSQESSR